MPALAVLALASQMPGLRAAPRAVNFSQPAQSVAAFDSLEIALNVSEPDPANPFTEVTVTGEFTRTGGPTFKVDGFCDAADGSLFRIRFMPSQTGQYTYSVKYQQGAYEATHTGSFTAEDQRRKGMVRVDPKYPWHFLWEGTGEHYFYNGTTTYFLAGWDEAQIRQNLDRLARLKVNRVRAAIAGRVENGRAWFEPVYLTDRFRFLLNPWVAKRPDSVKDPGLPSCSIKPANTTQSGPARIVTLSKDTGQRSFTLGQKGGAYEMRFRTTATSNNGEPALSTPGGEDADQRTCGLRNASGDLAVLYFPAGGSVALKPQLQARQLKPRWYNPRTGQWLAAPTSPDNTFAAPDKHDWALLLERRP